MKLRVRGSKKGANLAGASAAWVLIQLATGAVIHPAYAQTPAPTFDIPAQSLSSALLSFGRQAGISISLPNEFPGSAQNAPLVGAFTPADALGKLLEGTGMGFEFVDPETVRISKMRTVRRSETPNIPQELPQQAIPAVRAVAPSAIQLEEIIVTARRKEEKAQTVPISLESFGQQDLKDRDIRNSTEFAKATPGLTVSAVQPTSQHTWVRGITGIVGYFDGAPEFTVTGRDIFFDVSSVQVLKGPQGTLFGIATNGGAVVVEPNKPRNDFEGWAEVTVGNYNRNTQSAVINMPVVEDKFLVRAGVSHSHTDGYIRDIARGIDLNDENYNIGRIAATLLPTDNVSNEFLAGYWDSSVYSVATLTVLRVNPAGLAQKFYGAAFTQAFALQQQVGLYAGIGDDLNGAPFNKTYQWNLIDTATWDIADNLTVKNILSYIEIRNSSRAPGYLLGSIDVVNGRNSLPNGYVPYPYTPTGPTVQYAEELQLQGRAMDDKLSYTLGTFNQFTGIRGPHPIDCTTSFSALSCSGNASGSGTTNAVYGQATYDLSTILEGLSFTGGYRYTWDRIYSESNAYSIVGGVGVRVPNSSGSAVGYFKDPSYTMSLDYQLDPLTMIYISDSKGYSKGGFNNFSAPSSLHSYQPETLNSVEIGFKTDQEVFGMKSRANMAAYYGFYNSIQTTQGLVVVVGGVTSTPQVTTNVANGYTEGVDGEFTIIPTESTELYANIAYNHAAFEHYPSLDTTTNPPTPIDLTSQRVLVAPMWKFTVRGTYHLPLEWVSRGRDLGDLSVTASYWWQSVTNHGQGIFAGFSALGSLMWHPDYGTMDITVNWRDMLGFPGLHGAFFITNVDNNIWTGEGNAGYNNLGFYAMRINAPRMMGVTLRYSFGP